MTFNIGQLVKYRNRDWIVQPSPKGEEEILLLRPLGGSEIEEVGVFKALVNQIKLIQPTELHLPSVHTGNSLTEAKLLYEANRLSFRQASGPIRSIAKLSFRPRAYQLVPLVLALRQLEQDTPLRLLIADDVGVGKTIEALMVMLEMMERRIIRTVSVLCPPHLCDQWQEEIRSKISKEAVIVRSSTFKQLEGQVPAGRTLWQHYPLTVVSLDFVKQRDRVDIFVSHAPDLVIVDEVHTCAKPEGQQQARHQLLARLMAEKQSTQHLLLLTATPHSGKEDEFKSILKLLKPEFEAVNLTNNQDQKKLAPHYVQRRRQDLVPWLDPQDKFPERVSSKSSYSLGHKDYKDFYNGLITYTSSVAQRINEIGSGKEKMKFWAALALLRGALSSPATAEIMIQNRINRLKELEQNDVESVQDEIETEGTYTMFSDSSDQEEIQLMNQNLDAEDAKPLEDLLAQSMAIKQAMTSIGIFDKVRHISLPDPKLGRLLLDLHNLFYYNTHHDKDARPIVFCTFIGTAKYLGEVIKVALPNVKAFVITSELADQDRKQQIEAIQSDTSNYILIATDCLSEGINLQDKFNYVIHYDMPWNPNRIEQREGRVDRFGQTALEITTKNILTEDSIVDARIMSVLIDKIKAIKTSLGGFSPILDAEISLREQLLQDFLKGNDNALSIQQNLFESEWSNQVEQARQAAETIKSIYSHNNKLEPETLKQEIAEMDHSIGSPEVVEWLTNAGLKFFGFTIEPQKATKHEAAHYLISLTNNETLGAIKQEILKLKRKLKSETQYKVSFYSPTPAGMSYLGRNHPLVALLAQMLIKHGLSPQQQWPGLRSAAIRTDQVLTTTTLVMARMRNVITSTKKQKGNKGESHQFVAEEMYLWGFTKVNGQYQWLPQAACQALFDLPKGSSRQIDVDVATSRLTDTLSAFGTEEIKTRQRQLAEERSTELACSHGRLGKAVDTVYTPTINSIIPPDVMGVYVFIPIPKAL